MTVSRLNLPVLISMLFLSHLISAQVQPKGIALYPVGKSTPLCEIMATVTRPKDTGINPTYSTPSVVMPLTEYRITSGFGWRKHPITGKRDFHNGIDLATRAGIVQSIMEGTVESIGYHRNLGNYVCIDHGFVHSVYGHLSRVTVKSGQAIAAGYPVGITGKSGRATGEHLHFSIRSNGIYIDPWKFLSRILQHIKNEH